MESLYKARQKQLLKNNNYRGPVSQTIPKACTQLRVTLFFVTQGGKILLKRWSICRDPRSAAASSGTKASFSKLSSSRPAMEKLKKVRLEGIKTEK